MNKFLKKNKYLVVAAVVIIVVVAYVYFKGGKDNEAPENRMIETQPQGGSLVLFHMDGCGACSAMMNDWKQASQELQKMGVDVQEYEAGKFQKQMESIGIQGFPTIRLYPKGFPGSDQNEKYIEYQGNRQADDIINFGMSGGSSQVPQGTEMPDDIPQDFGESPGQNQQYTAV